MTSEPSEVFELSVVLGRMAEEIRRFAPKAPISEYPELEFPSENREAVEGLLRRMKRLDGIEKKMLRSVTWGASLNIPSLARSLLERLSLGDEPGAIAADFLDFFNKTSHHVYYMAGISGLELDKSVQLAPNIKLAPIEEIRASAAREFVFRVDRFHRFRGSIGHEIPRPKVALLISSDQQVVFANGESISNALNSKMLGETEARALMCITLSGEAAAPVLTAKTSWIDHAAQSYHGLAGFSAGTSPAQQYPLTYGALDIETLQELFKQCESLSQHDEAILRLAVGRLRRSRLHETNADRAIDLGTALEILTLQNAGNNELSYRISLRAACLIEQELAGRKKAFEIAKAAYEARSTAVHTGLLSNKKYVDALLPADRLCSDLAKTIIRGSGLPKDWEEIVMSR